jgi:hypothetical protein
VLDHQSIRDGRATRGWCMGMERIAQDRIARRDVFGVIDTNADRPSRCYNSYYLYKFNPHRRRRRRRRALIVLWYCSGTGSEANSVHCAGGPKRSGLGFSDFPTCSNKTSTDQTQ